MLNYFDITNYNGDRLTNLTQRVVSIKKKIKLYDTYYPYTIKEGERPDTIAYDYYGSSDYSWLILIVNDIYDVYSQWPLTYNQFVAYMEKKYGEDFIMTQSQVTHYENPDYDFSMSIETWNKSTPEQRMGWSPVYLWDYEDRLNENKRSIKLISNRFLPQIDREMQEMFA